MGFDEKNSTNCDSRFVFLTCALRLYFASWMKQFFALLVSSSSSCINAASKKEATTSTTRCGFVFIPSESHVNDLSSSFTRAFECVCVCVSHSFHLRHLHDITRSAMKEKKSVCV